MSTEDLYFQYRPVIAFAGNTFVNCPVILRYDDEDLVSTVHCVDTKTPRFTHEFRIYGPSGDYIAKCKGARLFDTESGKASGIKLVHEPGLVACSLNGQSLFEVRKSGAAAVAVSAELYTKDGAFLRCKSVYQGLVKPGSDSIVLGRVFMSGNTFKNIPIALHVASDGRFAIGGLIAAHD